MVDSYGRNIDYLRVSVTDRCNLRCQYCMPADGLEMTSHEEVLSFDEIVRICRVMSQNGVKKIKLTGGEPLVRKDVINLVRDIKNIPGIKDVTMTTNGVLLPDVMDDLACAGIDAINVSLDTMDRELFKKITRRDNFDKVIKGIYKALEYPDISLKINCVPLGIEGQKLTDVAELARDNKIHVRFIEMMPIGFGKKFEFKSEENIVKMLGQEFGNLERFNKPLGNGPCHYYKIDGFTGKIGFISAISHKFCGECNRVRLTSQGFLKTCLQYEKGKSLRELMRDGCSDKELEELITQAIYEKPDGHRFLSGKIENEDILAMSQIGG